jgi:CPA2 family monovalent cation:H+ antiporter-2
MQETIFVRDLAVALLAAAGAGWLLQRIGLSAVVGYLLAGMAIGPFSPAVQLVSNLNHIQLLAQIGLVFMMFAIGLGLNLARLQRMGLSIIFSVAISSIVLFNVCRLFGAAMGWSGFQTLFLAGTLMISSSAIIIKILDELNLTHQRAGQLALGITVLEDVVAIVLLTLFLSLSDPVGGPGTSFWKTLGLLGTFVVLLVVVAVLLMPRLLKLFSRGANAELRLTMLAGTVLLAAVWAVQSGYSLALGAFVLGVVVAGTRHRDEVENSFAPIQTVFGALFFVAVGMMFDYRHLLHVAGLVTAVTLLTVIARPLACAFGLVTVGHSTRNALKAGLALTPVGEFAFVLIQIGKSSNLLPESFYALAIGVSLATAVVGPLLTRRSEAIAAWVEAREPKAWREAVAFYHRWLAELQNRGKASLLWKLTSKRVLHVAFHLLFVSALFLVSNSIYAALLERFGRDLFFPNGLPVLYWISFGVVVLGPLVVIWRHGEVLAMLLSEGLTQGTTRGDLLRPLLQTMLKAVAACLLLAWLLVMVPFGPWVFWTSAGAVACVLVFAPFFWRRLVRVHSRFELEFREKMKAASTPGSTSGLPATILERPQEWNLEIDELTLAFSTAHAGRSIAELNIRKRFGCSIVAIERQGLILPNPSARERLYGGDKLLLLGTGEQLPVAAQFLHEGARGDADAAGFEDVGMETLTVPEHAPHLGRTLMEWGLIERHGIQVCGIQRGEQRLLIPSSEERILAGDRLLLLGPHDKIRDFRTMLGRSALRANS